MLNVAEWIFSAFLVSNIISFSLGAFIGSRRIRERLIQEEARARKWKERAYRMVWGLPISDGERNEAKFAGPVPCK